MKGEKSQNNTTVHFATKEIHNIERMEYEIQEKIWLTFDRFGAAMAAFLWDVSRKEIAFYYKVQSMSHSLFQHEKLNVRLPLFVVGTTIRNV